MPEEKMMSAEEWERFKAKVQKEFPNVKITRVDEAHDEDHDIRLIRRLLAKPMEERMNFLRVRTEDGIGTHL